MNSTRKRKYHHDRLRRAKRLTVQGDIYDVPESPPPAKWPKNGSRRPRNPSEDTPGNTIHVSRREPLSASKQLATPRSELTMIQRIQESLKPQPNTVDGILHWIRDKYSSYHQPRGQKVVRANIQRALGQRSYSLGVWEWNLGASKSCNRGTERGGETQLAQGTVLRESPSMALATVV
jgi:hypothetical protein